MALASFDPHWLSLATRWASFDPRWLGLATR
jgi:hypothetical protein